MKSILKHLFIFVALVLAISSFNGCGGSRGANNANSNANVNANIANSNSNANAYSSVAGIDYPPVASSLADAEFELLDGSKLKVSGEKGKVVLLNIWGIWCGPCRAEMPQLIKLQDQYRDKGLEIVGLNIGDEDGGVESVDAIKKFVEAQHLNYTIARAVDPAGTKAFYEVTKKSVVPQSVLVDRQGRLRGVFAGFGANVSQSLDQTVEKVVNEQ
ncbi:MAG: TlpA disulfide reductase family protein [Pyrinomonadaceae bacterium]